MKKAIEQIIDRTRAGALVRFTSRIPAKTIREFDKLASRAVMSRNDFLIYVIERIVEDAPKSEPKSMAKQIMMKRKKKAGGCE